MNFSSYYRSKDSFTLVELLVVIGILAILTAAVVIVLNPAELLKQSRDSKRTTDLASINNAIKLLLTQNPDVNLGSASTVYVSLSDSSSTCGSYALPALPSGWKYNCVAAASFTKADGSGWIPVNFLNGASQLSTLPTDPQNDANTRQYYTYAAANGRWELASSFESGKYAAKEVADGGTDPAYYEEGSVTNLLSFANGLIGYWNFEGTLSDASGFGNNGTWYGTSTSRYAEGRIGQGGNFVGANSDYIDTGLSANLSGQGDFSVIAWVKMTGLNYIVSQTHSVGGYTSDWIAGYMSNQPFWFRSAILSFGPNNLNNNAWRHIAMVWNKTTRKYKGYIDGALIGEIAAGSDFGGMNSIKIGTRGDATAYFSTGIIDEVGIYARALSDAEVQAIYNASK